jgi:diguanylate cyclase (GGDEF)-like protein/PAS domain S-box-containing protein
MTKLPGLRARVALMVALPFAVVVALFVLSFLREREGELRLARETVLQLARSMAVELRTHIDIARRLTTSPSLYESLADPAAPNGCKSAVASQSVARAPVDRLVLVSGEGETLCASDGDLGPAPLSVVRRVLGSGLPALGLERTDDEREAPPMLYAGALLVNGRPKAVAIASLSPRLLQLDFDRAGLPAGSTLTVIDGDGKILYLHPHGDGSWVGTYLTTMLHSQAGVSEGTTITTSTDGVERVYGYAQLFEADTVQQYVIVGVPRETVLAPVDHRLYLRLALALSVLTATFLYAAWRGDRIFVRPVLSLAGMANRIRHGDLRARSGVHAGTHEMLQLASSLDAMAEALETERAARDKLSARFARLPAATACIDRNGVVEYANAAFAAWVGKSASELVGAHIRDVVPEDVLAEALPYIEQARRGHSQHFSVSFGSSGGERKYAEAFLVPEGDAGGLILFAHDATAHKAQYEAMAHLAQIDALTGLPNRRTFAYALQSALRRARVQNAGVAVLFVDLDRFKEINDTRGHRVGDLVLQSFAALLRKSVRQRDVVGRLSGDEFVVLLEDINSPEALAVAVGNVDTALKMPQTIDGVTMTLRASVGAAYMAPGSSATAEELLSAADADMYRRKRAAAHREAVDGL